MSLALACHVSRDFPSSPAKSRESAKYVITVFSLLFSGG
jgi:hypothetical protein